MKRLDDDSDRTRSTFSYFRTLSWIYKNKYYISMVNWRLTKRKTYPYLGDFFDQYCLADKDTFTIADFFVVFPQASDALLRKQQTSSPMS